MANLLNRFIKRSLQMISILLAILIALSFLACKVPAPPIKPCPGPELLEFPSRPRPLVVMPESEPDRLLDKIIATIEREGFEVKRVYRGSSPEILAIRSDKGGFDKVIIWLERNFQDPLTLMDVHFEYSRYEELFRYPSPQPIEIDPYFEELRVGELKESLRSLSK